MNDDMMRMVRYAVIIAGTVILAYFVLGLVRSGGQQASGVAGAIQDQIH